jgi:hypothetical protein
MNHCGEFAAKIGDWFIHEPGDAFFPTIDAEMRTVFGTPVDGPFEFACDNLSVVVRLLGVARRRPRTSW